MPTARGWYHPAAIVESLMLRQRVYFAAITGALAFFACPSDVPGTVRTSIAWDASGLVYLLLAFRLMYSCGADHIKAVAEVRDDSRVYSGASHPR
jgi:uncharacterized membrane protein